MSTSWGPKSNFSNEGGSLSHKLSPSNFPLRKRNNGNHREATSQNCEVHQIYMVQRVDGGNHENMQFKSSVWVTGMTDVQATTSLDSSSYSCQYHISYRLLPHTDQYCAGTDESLFLQGMDHCAVKLWHQDYHRNGQTALGIALQNEVLFTQLSFLPSLLHMHQI